MDELTRNATQRREWLKRAALVLGALSGTGLSACGGGSGSGGSSGGSSGTAPNAGPPANSPTNVGGITPPPPSSSAQPFRNARTNQRYATLQAAMNDAAYPIQSGDTIKVTAGTYVITSSTSVGSLNNVATDSVDNGITLNTLTIEWEIPGSPALFDLSQWAKSTNAVGGDVSGITMGIPCTNLTIRGVWLRGYRQIYHLNCGVRILSGYGQPINFANPATLTVEYCKFYEFSDGILTRPYYNFSIFCNYCIFQDNGNGDGLTHGIYVSDNLEANFFGCSFYTTANSVPQPGLGHLIKSRARTTKVTACLFNPAYGTATCIDFANGGSVFVTGNVILRYGAAQFADDNPAIKFGEEQTPYYNANSPQFGNNTDNYVHDGRTHSILLAQNTIRILQPEGGPPLNVMNVTMPTTDLPNIDQPMTVAQTVRNNIVGNDTGTATKFVATYPDDSAVAYATIGNGGQYANGVIPGNPAVNDAPYAWTGDYQVPAGRSDTNRGGVIA